MKYLSQGQKESYTLVTRKRRQNAPWTRSTPNLSTSTRRKSNSENNENIDQANLNNSNCAQQNLFELLEKVQSTRLDDQRCVLPAYFTEEPRAKRGTIKANSKLRSISSKNMQSSLLSHHNKSIELISQLNKLESPELLLKSALKNSVPHPMVVLQSNLKYWVDGTHHEYILDSNKNPILSQVTGRYKLEISNTATCYRKYFVGRDHLNLLGYDEQLGPILLSLQNELIRNEEHIRIIMRMQSGTIHEVIPICSLEGNTNPVQIAKVLNEQINIENFIPIIFPGASSYILKYDEHILYSNFKFGIVYQKFGQTTEEELFSNNEISPSFKEFLECLGQRIKLKNHKGKYKGGLDTDNNETGHEAVYECYKGHEIMFHVSSMLPYIKGDSQQLQRKRHIGNDIVTIVFQEPNSTFTPDMLISSFIHTFIVVQPIGNCSNTIYKISIVAKHDVPFFGPTLPTPTLFRSGKDFKDFLLTKLINAENASYKAEKFSKLESRTRISLLLALVKELKTKTSEFLGRKTNNVHKASGQNENEIKTRSAKIFGSVTKVLNTKSQASKAIISPILINNSKVSETKSSAKKKKLDIPNRLRKYPDNQRLSKIEETSKGNLDTTLDSCSQQNHFFNLLENSVMFPTIDSGTENLMREVQRLKCDKLDLLRQNVNCQREINAFGKEILRLRDLLKTFMPDFENDEQFTMPPMIR